MIRSYIFMFSFLAVCSAFVQRLDAQRSPGITIYCDMDFVIAIDGVALGLTGVSGRPVQIPLASGSYRVTVVSRDGDMWQQQAMSPSEIKVSLADSRRARLERIAAVEATKKQLNAKSTELASTRDYIKVLSIDPNVGVSLRRKIAAEIVKYNSLYGHDSNERTALQDHASSLVLDSLGRDDISAGIGNTVSLVQRYRAHRLGPRIEAYKRVLARLGAALEDPFRAVGSDRDGDYTRISHDANHAKNSGSLTLSRGSVVFIPKNASGTLKLQCSEVNKVDFRKTTFTIKTRGKTYDFKVGHWQDAEFLYGDMHLSCPNLAKGMTSSQGAEAKGLSAPPSQTNATGRPISSTAGRGSVLVTTDRSCYESTVTSPTIFKGNGGEVFKLTDGTLWTVKYGYGFLSAINPSVLACPESGKLTVSGKSIDVKRLLGCQETSILSPTPFKGNSGEVFKVADGTFWEVKYGSAYLSEYNPKVVICQDQGELRLNEKTIDVRQISGCHESAVSSLGIFKGNKGDTFTLTDGSEWEVAYGYAFLSELNPQVLVCPKDGTLRVGGKAVPVRQISGPRYPIRQQAYWRRRHETEFKAR